MRCVTVLRGGLMSCVTVLRSGPKNRYCTVRLINILCVTL